MKAKELVTLRKKEMKNGGYSLYLDFAINGVRYKEYLKMYLIPEKTKLDKIQNEETLKIAQAAKAKKVIELQSDSVNIKRVRGKDMILYDYIMEQAKEYKEGNHIQYGSNLEKLAMKVRTYHRLVSIRTVDKKWLIDFISFLHKTGLSDGTVYLYFSNLNTVFNRAYRAEIINENPITRMSAGEKPKKPDTEREYLTLEEVKRLMGAPCANQTTKRSFLFACFTGLRLSDVEQLKWENIKPATDGGLQIEKRQKKTRGIVYIPLTDNAIQQMPKKGQSDYVFYDMPERSCLGKHLFKWVKAAGIKKHISFHCSRHTYATLLLTFGADLYTVSSLLGHSKIATTQIYAKVVNQKKKEAVNLIPTIG